MIGIQFSGRAELDAHGIRNARLDVRHNRVQADVETLAADPAVNSLSRLSVRRVNG